MLSPASTKVRTVAVRATVNGKKSPAKTDDFSYTA
jgi:hypothetical protein